MQNTDCKPVETECPNCHQKILAWRDPNGVAKWVCPRCRTKTVNVSCKQDNYLTVEWSDSAGMYIEMMPIYNIYVLK